MWKPWRAPEERRFIFLCYRHDDTREFTRRLAEDLKKAFGNNAVFRDEDMTGGVDFPTFLDQKKMSCELMAVVIGKNWLAPGPDGKRRIDMPDDWVCGEISTGIRRNIDLLPICYESSIPTEDQLPESIRTLSRRQGLFFPSNPQGYRFALAELCRILEHRGFSRIDATSRPEIVLLIVGIILLYIGFSGIVGVTLIPTSAEWKTSASVAGWRLVGVCASMVIGLGLGLPCVVVSRWMCCGRRAERNALAADFFSANATNVQKSRCAVAAIACGLASFGLHAITAIPAAVLAIWSLYDISKHHGWLRGRGIACMALVCAILGSLFAHYMYATAHQLYRSYQLVDQANEEVAAGNAKTAKQLLQEAIDIFPLREAYVALGCALYEEGDLTNALRSFNRGLRRGTENSVVFDRNEASRRLKAKAYLLRSRIHKQQGDVAAADRDLLIAKDFNPEIEDK
jgi:hypothetical protein